MREPEDLQLRGLALLLVIFAGLLLLFGRLFQLQILGGEDWTDRSRRNQIRTQQISPHRGLMMDRAGRVLVANKPAYAVYGIPARLLSDSSAVIRLAELCQRDPESMFRRLSRQGRHSLKAVRLVSDIPFDLRVYLAENRLDFPGVDVQVESKRNYPEPAAPHVLGYLSELKEDELAEGLVPDGSPGDLIGRKGLERYYDAGLRGEKGVEYFTVDVRGRVLGPAPDPPAEAPLNGRDLQLSIDLDLQHRAEELLGKRRGSVVMAEVKTGRVLCYVSHPDYLLEYFSGRMPPEVWERLSDEESRPLLNRPVQGLYPPGSLFKVALAAWALEHGIVDETWTVVCKGAFQLGRRTARCWKEEGHGAVNMREAIQHSCDVWFYQLGLKLSPDHIREVGEAFGMTRPTGIDLDGEKTGLIPDVAWYDKQFGPKGWTRGVMLNLAIGQGEILQTPLQQLHYACLLANRGQAHDLRIGRRWIDRAGGQEEIPPGPLFTLELSDRAWRLIERSTQAVVESPGGTAHRHKRAAFVSAGKTGTAENPHGEAHAWYMGWMPEPDPEIAVVALVENAGHGSEEAAPIVFALFDTWMELKEGRLLEVEP